MRGEHNRVARRQRRIGGMAAEKMRKVQREMGRRADVNNERGKRSIRIIRLSDTVDQSCVSA